MFKYKGGSLPIGRVIHPRVWKNNKNLAIYGQFITFNKNTTFIATRTRHSFVSHYIVINQHIIVEIDDWLCVMFWNHDGYMMATVRATQWLHNEIHDVLRRDNFVTKTNVNLIVKNH